MFLLLQSKGVFQMECEVTSSPAPAYGGGSRNGMAPNGSGTATPPGRNPTASPGSGSTKSHLHVGFMDNGEVKEKREKYLTAKYGSHQMNLIRKRLSVEMWLYDELQKLYEEPVSIFSYIWNTSQFYIFYNRIMWQKVNKQKL